MYRPDNYSVHSDLFMSSVDESGVSTNPLFGAWRDPTRCMNSRLHVCCGKFLEGGKKNCHEAKSPSATCRISFIRPLVKAKGRAGSETRALISTNWQQLCLIRLNYFYPPGFKTLSGRWEKCHAQTNTGTGHSLILFLKVASDDNYPRACHLQHFKSPQKQNN